jgi:glycosyltransferase involved in cell wall biosynthesis
VVEYLSAADAFVLASYSEGRPNVVLESFAVGLPVIATDIDGVRELVKEGETGLRFQAGNSRELAKQIERLQKKPELQALLSSRGREFIQQNQLLWTNVGQRYADLYKEAIGARA